jgi:CheY-like chemotaxis protein
MAILDRTIPKMIRIKCELSGDAPRVKADPAQIVQIILNLCTNARDAMPDGGVISISTETKTLSGDDLANHPDGDPGDYLLLKVGDNGLGMDEETLGRIFEPFFTTKEVGQGSGLGLSTVYGIVKNHGGLIECESRPGRGTTFFVYLPLSTEDAVSEREEVHRVPPATGDETILIADDDEAVLELARAILEHQGYTVITAARGEDALEKFVRMPKRFSLIILDLGMPGMGGRRCMEAILKIDPSARVLIASGYSEDREAAGIIEAGALGFVGKPYRLTDLGRKVREILDR